MKIANTAGSTGLDNTEAKIIKIKITDVRDVSIRENTIVETILTLQAADTKVPRVASFFTVKSGGTIDDDTIKFYFSEAMDVDTAKDLGNYVVTSPAGAVLVTAQALSLYGDTAKFKEMSSDGKAVTLTIKDTYNNSTDVIFTLSGLKDIAGNMLTTGYVQKVSTPKGPSITSARITGASTIEINYDQEIGSFAPNSVVVREAITANATISGIVIKTVTDSITSKKVVLTLDKSIGTDNSKAYLSQLDNILVKNVYDYESTTFAAFQLTDAAKPTVTFTATSAGILIKFSEIVNKTSATLLAEMTLTEDGADKFSIVVITAIDNKTFKVGGLEKNVEYKISLYPRGTVDVAGNSFVPIAETRVTTRE